MTIILLEAAQAQKPPVVFPEERRSVRKHSSHHFIHCRQFFQVPLTLLLPTPDRDSCCMRECLSVSRYW